MHFPIIINNREMLILIVLILTYYYTTTARITIASGVVLKDTTIYRLYIYITSLNNITNLKYNTVSFTYTLYNGYNNYITNYRLKIKSKLNFRRYYY